MDRDKGAYLCHGILFIGTDSHSVTAVVKAENIQDAVKKFRQKEGIWPSSVKYLCETIIN